MKRLSRYVVVILCFVFVLNAFSAALADEADVADKANRELVRYWMGIEIPEDVPCEAFVLLDENREPMDELDYHFDIVDEKTGESKWLLIRKRADYISLALPVPDDDDPALISDEPAEALIAQICERYNLFDVKGEISYEEYLAQHNAVFFCPPLSETVKRIWHCFLDGDTDEYCKVMIHFDVQDMNVNSVFLYFEDPGFSFEQ